MSDDTRLVTVTEIAKLLGVQRHRVDDAIERLDLKATGTVGSTRQFHYSVVAEIRAHMNTIHPVPADEPDAGEPT